MDKAGYIEDLKNKLKEQEAATENYKNLHFKSAGACDALKQLIKELEEDNEEETQ